jgi:CTP:molybdopterin cytidylyltransferase MocA
MTRQNATAIRDDLGVIILAAGASSLPWRGTSVAGHLISQWRQLGAAQIAIVCRPGDAALNAELDRVAFPKHDRIENPNPQRGMFSSLLCAANWNGWKSALSVWAITLGDQPHLRTSTLAALLRFQYEHADAICQPAYDGRARHPVLLPKAAFDELKQTRAETLKEFLQQTPCPIASCALDDPGLALDLDSPEDYAKALVLIQPRSTPELPVEGSILDRF